jgi:ribonuclease P protein component
MKLNRLRGRKICDRVRTKGRVFRGRTMVIRFAPSYPLLKKEGMNVGTYAPASLHKSAVKRNRMRRRCREALRIIVKNMHVTPSIQILLCPRQISLICPFEEIARDIKEFFRYHHP